MLLLTLLHLLFVIVVPLLYVIKLLFQRSEEVRKRYA